MKYHGQLYGKIIGKYIPLKHHSDYVDKLERDLDSQRHLAGELIAAIRINATNGTLVTSDYKLIEEWLQPFVSRLIPYEAPTGREK